MNDHLTPNHEIDSELLSAYLDDELTASERVVVEKALLRQVNIFDIILHLRSIYRILYHLPLYPDQT